jgi:hypothetical protein
MPSTDRKLELKAKTSVAQTDSQPYVYAKGLIQSFILVSQDSNLNLYEMWDFHMDLHTLQSILNTALC